MQDKDLASAIKDDRTASERIADEHATLPNAPVDAGPGPKRSPWSIIPKGDRANGLVVLNNGGTEIHKDITGNRLEVGNRTHWCEPRGWIWLDKPIPAGRLYIWPEDDELPFTGRVPINYGSKLLNHLVGDYPFSLFDANMRKDAIPFKFRAWMKQVFLVVGAIIVLGGGAYAYWQKAKQGSP